MTTPAPFELMLAFAAIGICMCFGVLLRATVPFFQKYLVPASLIASFIGVLAFNASSRHLGGFPVSAETFQAIAYHLFVISFISIGLTSVAKSRQSRSAAAQVTQGAVWLGLMNTFSMSTQILLGLGLASLLGFVGFQLHPNFGYLLSLGFTQGPGQALALGGVWEKYGQFTHGINLALTFASLGFVFAYLFGVPLANYGVRRGITACSEGTVPEYVQRGLHREREETETAGHMPMHTGNIDTFAFQVSVVGVVYAITYFGMYLVNKYIVVLTNGWGFFFCWALLVAFGVQLIMRKLKIFYLMDSGVQRRISGFAVDFLVVATLFPISLPVVWQYIVPILVICIAGALWTLGIGYYLGRRMHALGFERMLSIFGVNTGTMASGLLLLRIVDPEYRTTVCAECGAYVMFAMPGITALLTLMLYGGQWGLGRWALIGIYAAISVACLILIRVLGCWQPPQDWSRKGGDAKCATAAPLG
jgi:ESS family glutamate:Na+ symporter